MQSISPFKEYSSMKLGLEVMNAFLKYFGNPHQKFPMVHVGGTNGKGSVCTKIAVSAMLSGKKTGLFTSPHLFSINERFQINGQNISDERLEHYLKVVERATFALKATPSFFEIMTLICFLYFSEEKVDLGVIEVGLGGRLDATNVIHPLLSVITSISLEHTSILGSTLELIAKEKAGIIKERVPIVLGPKANQNVFFEIAKDKNASVHCVKDENNPFYDLENQLIALKALEILEIEPLGIDFRPKCRLEEISPGILMDVAHNPNGFERTFESISFLYPGKKIHMLCGMSQDKDVASSLKVASQYVTSAHFIKANYERLMEPNELQKLYPKESFTYGKASKALEHLKLIKHENDLILVMGSFFIMQEIHDYLKSP